MDNISLRSISFLRGKLRGEVVAKISHLNRDFLKPTIDIQIIITNLCLPEFP